MELNEKFGLMPGEEAIKKTVAALEANGVRVFVVQNSAEAKQKVLELIPEGAGVMNMTSQTLEKAGIVKEILESGRYDAVRNKLAKMNPETDGKKMREAASAPDWAVGSVHAVTEDGKVLIASGSGSQLPAYAYGAKHVLWVAGAQKLVKNLEEGMKRIYEYSFPLEDERFRKLNGRGSNVRKILVVNSEVPNRITLVIVKENLGF